MKKNRRVSIIIPVYNEEDLIRETHDRIKSSLEKIKTIDYELIFVNDGSTDHSLQILKQLHDHDSNMVLINFSKNFGHQNALTAGLDYADGDAIVFIDADLQDPPEVIQEMIGKWQTGYEQLRLSFIEC
jgi:glycosyltransferase involved in cell wall biosynthesis